MPEKKPEWVSMDVPIEVKVEESLLSRTRARRSIKPDGSMLEADPLGGDRIQLGLRNADGKLIRQMTVSVTNNQVLVNGYRLRELESFDQKDTEQRNKAAVVLQEAIIAILI